MNDCRPQCIDLLELLALLTAKVDYLYLFYRSLSLSDLTDVENCLAPLKNLHLVFNGEVWNAENQKEVTLTVEPLIDSGVAIANITFNGDTTTIYCKDGTRVEVTPKSISGSTMDIATITVDGVTETIKSKDFTGDINIINLNIENINSNIRTILRDITDIYNIINNLHNTEVIVTPLRTSGEKIATISVDGVVKDLYAPTQVSDGILNIKINNINGTVSNRIASLTLTGADINITGYTESEDVNDDLELAPTDTVNEAFGKLAKALKDDEAAVTRAFLQVESSTGFNDNLEYVPETAPSMLANATDLTHADSILRTHIETIEQAIETIRNTTLTLTKGASGTFNALTTGSKTVTIPWGGNTTNLMKDYPPENGNYYADIQTVLSASEVLPLLSGGDLFPGRCITFATGPDSSVAGRDIWKTYQYVGPLEDDTVSYTHYTNINYWKEIV